MANPTNFRRGRVVGITVTVQYPDGTRKTRQLADPAGIAAIAFHPAFIPRSDIGLFDVSAADWTQNPCMLVYGGMAFDKSFSCLDVPVLLPRAFSAIKT